MLLNFRVLGKFWALPTMYREYIFSVMFKDMGKVNRANGGSRYLLLELSFAVISAVLSLLRPPLVCVFEGISTSVYCEYDKRFMANIFCNVFSEEEQRFAREWVETLAVALLYK